MAAYTHNMSELVWYWPRVGTGDFGEIEYGEPEERMVRWQDTTEVVTDADGRQIVSSAIVYVDRPVAEQGKMQRGVDCPDDQPPPEAREVIRVGQSPSLDQTTVLHKAWLK